MSRNLLIFFLGILLLLAINEELERKERLEMAKIKAETERLVNSKVNELTRYTSPDSNIIMIAPHYESAGESGWINPAGKDFNINKDPNHKLLWEQNQKQRVIIRDKALEEFDDGEIEDYYESIRD